MNKLVAILAVAILLPACSGGGGSSSSTLPHAPAAAAISSPAQPLSVSGAHRLPKDSFGGVLGILLLDAPPRIAQGTQMVTPLQVNVGVVEVDAIRDDGLIVQIVAYSQPLVVNLLDYQSSSLNLGTGGIAAGHYSTMRLVLDTSKSSINLAGWNIPLNAMPPSSSETAPTGTQPLNYNASTIGVTIPTSISVDPTTYSSQTVSFDFNAAESVGFSSATGSFVMAPAVFAAATSTPASVSGTVLNSSGTGVNNVTVVAYRSNWSVANTATTNGSGAFKIKNLDPGTYSLYVYNKYTTAAGQDNDGQGESATAPSSGGIVGPQITVSGSNITGVNITD